MIANEETKRKITIVWNHISVVFACIFIALVIVGAFIRYDKERVRGDVTITEHAFDPQIINRQVFTPDMKYTASISGSVYYPIGCAAISRIKEENRIYFLTSEEAVLAGYRPASRC